MRSRGFARVTRVLPWIGRISGTVYQICSFLRLGARVHFAGNFAGERRGFYKLALSINIRRGMKIAGRASTFFRFVLTCTGVKYAG